MELYLIRHGIAVEQQAGLADEERELSKEGRQKTEKIAQKLISWNWHFDLIVSSPLVRARQTSEILISTGLTSQSKTSEYLAPDGSIHEWLTNWFVPQNYHPETKLALVGHEPDLSHWAEIFLWGEAKGSLILKKAGIIGLKLPENDYPLGRSQMFLLIQPKYLI
jgi:phosphohistidine phosphatase